MKKRKFINHDSKGYFTFENLDGYTSMLVLHYINFERGQYTFYEYTENFVPCK